MGPKSSEQLAQVNVRRVAEVAAMPVEVLAGLFGARGKKLRDLARGVDSRPVEPYRPAQSVSRCTSFEPPVCEMAFLEAMLDHLLERAASCRCASHDQAAKGLTVGLRHADHHSAEARATLAEPCNDESLLKSTRARSSPDSALDGCRCGCSGWNCRR